MTVNGGPDANPRFPKVISQAVSHFRKFELDVLVIVTNAPGRSCFNRVERIMAPWSHQLSLLVLPYDSFGNHLDDQRRTVDDELEVKNFEIAGDILAQIWSKLIIDDRPVVAEYIDPGRDNVDVNPAEWTADWYQPLRQAIFPFLKTKQILTFLFVQVSLNIQIPSRPDFILTPLAYNFTVIVDRTYMSDVWIVVALEIRKQLLNVKTS